MMDHTSEAVHFWTQNKSCILVAVDFSKAYDSIQHVFVRALLTFLYFPPPYVAFVLALMRAELVIEVCGEVQVGVRLTRGRGCDTETPYPRYRSLC